MVYCGSLAGEKGGYPLRGQTMGDMEDSTENTQVGRCQIFVVAEDNKPCQQEYVLPWAVFLLGLVCHHPLIFS